MTKNSVAHDTVPYFMERFERAYTLQLQNFAQNVCTVASRPSSSGTASKRCASRSRQRPRTKPAKPVKVSSIQ